MDLANISNVQALIERGAIFYVGHSGGKDSQAMYHAVCQVVPRSHIRVIHADLGDIEWPGVKDHIKATIDHDLMIAQARDIQGKDINLFQMIRNRRIMLDSKGKHTAPAFPSSAARFCTSDLKTGPIWREIRQDGHPLVVNCVGIRAQESKARSKKVEQRGTLNLNKKNTNSKREAYDWWPVAHWSEQEVWGEIIDLAGQEPHAAYQTRLDCTGTYVTDGNERLSCQFCIFGSRNDLRNAKQANPNLYQRYIDLEIEVRGTMFNGESIAERVSCA